MALGLGAVYLTQVIRLTLLEPGQGQVNLIPFHTIWAYLSDVQAPLSLRFRNLAGNLVLLVPFGLLLATVTRLRPQRAAALVVATAAMIEGLQFLMGAGRSVDIDDVILNSIGGLLGIAVGVALLRLLGSFAPRALEALERPSHASEHCRNE